MGDSLSLKNKVKLIDKFQFQLDFLKSNWDEKIVKVDTFQDHY